MTLLVIILEAEKSQDRALVDLASAKGPFPGFLALSS